MEIMEKPLLRFFELPPHLGERGGPLTTNPKYWRSKGILKNENTLNIKKRAISLPVYLILS